VQTFFLPEVDAHICYQDLAGKEPTFVYIHGLGSASSADFPAVARHPHLFPYRAILVDLLGFGFSDRPGAFSYSLEAHAESVAKLLDHLGIRNCHLVGHSLGGSIAITLADARADLVHHLIVAEPNLEAKDATLSRTIADQPEENYIESGHAALIAEAESWAAEDASVASYPRTLRAADPRGMHRSAVSLASASLSAVFFALKIPRTYVFGALSLPDAHEATLRANGVPVLIVPDVGHAMMDANPEGVAQAIAASLT
jgi:pimeloyl-ACP methyl ester carboxylesterase